MSTLISPQNFIPNKVIIIEKVLIKSDPNERVSRIKYTMLATGNYDKAFESMIIEET